VTRLGKDKCSSLLGLFVGDEEKNICNIDNRTEIRSEHINRNGEPGSVDTAQPFKTVENMTNVVGLDFDYKSGRLYYTQVSLLEKTIFSFH
jgi:hypothetical protein